MDPRMPKIWLTTDGTPPTSILGAFSTRAGAEKYLAVLVDRYASGEGLRHMGQSVTKALGAWQLGLGPTVVDRDIDQRVEALAGAWVVKVDEGCRMVSCAFSTAMAPTHPSTTYRAGVHHICQAHGATPAAALEVAQHGMMAYLASPSARRQAH